MKNAQQPPDITVFIPVRNGANFIAHAINSIIRQSYQNWTLIIKDNNSSDNTREIVRSFMKDKRIQLHERDHDIGAVENRKSCLKNIPSKYFMILSHDDYLYTPDALSKAHDILEKNPDIPVVHCDMMYVDAHNRPILRRCFKRQGRISSNEIAKKSILTVRNLFGVPLLNRADAFDEKFISTDLSYTGDIQLSIAAGKGSFIYHIPEILIALRLHGNNRTMRKCDTIAAELRTIAARNEIPLSRLDNLMMVGNDYWQRFQKKFFFMYLDHFSKK